MTTTFQFQMPDSRYSKPFCISFIPVSFFQLSGGERDRLILTGVLTWQLSHEYAERLHKVKSALAETHEALELAEQRHASVMTALRGVPRQIDHFEARIDAVSPRISQMLLRLDATLLATDRALVALATGELDARRARLAQYLDQAHYALAALYDQAAAEGS